MKSAPTIPLSPTRHPQLSSLDSNTIPTLSLDESNLELEQTLLGALELHVPTPDTPSSGKSNRVDAVPIT